MRSVLRFAWLIPLSAALAASAQTEPAPVVSADQAMVNRFFIEALSHGQAYENLCALTAQHPYRLAGSKALDGAITWAQQTLGALPLDRVYTQDVMVPHWERGAPESIALLDATGRPQPLAAAALGNSGATPEAGLTAEVVEVHSLDEVRQLGRAKLAGKIVFFNRPMDSAFFRSGQAYGVAGDQRNQGPALAAAQGAVAVLTRSLTFALDDVPHTGNSAAPTTGPIPAAALSTLAANRLSSALTADPHTRVRVAIHSHLLPEAPSHNVIGEIRGSEFPDQIILVGGHLDSWDIAPGANDDGSGVVQSIEVLRLFRTLGVKPRHTIRCVLFTNEENGTRGALRYAELARGGPGRHLFALETDNGGFAPTGFNLGSTQGDAHLRAARWRSLFEPWGLWNFTKGTGGSDVAPLLFSGVTVAELTPDSQRYFDYHHTAIDTIDKVNPRELHLGAAAMASLLWLVDTQGL